MTQILQISDPHILPTGDLFHGQIDTAAALRTLLHRLSQMLPQLGPIESLVVTGDLSESGCKESYQLFSEIMQDCPLPWRAIPGNHDRRAPMAEVLGTEVFDWREDLDEITLIGMDTLVEGSGHGELSETQLEWLQAQLSDLGARPVLFFCHHPPVRSGIDAIDRIRLKNAQALEDALSQHEGPLQIGCGHLHRAMAARFANQPLFVAPGASCSFRHTVIEGAALRMTPHQGGALLHNWTAQDGFKCLILEPHDFAHPEGLAPLL